MRFLDRFLQKWRMRVAAPWIPDGARVLDIGCHRGEFLNYLGERIVDSVGIDPIAPEISTDNYRLIAAKLNETLGFKPNSFDVVVMLATLEHILDVEEVAFTCARILKPQGRVVLTVPNQIVDDLLGALKRIRVLDGMSIDEHQGLNPNSLPRIFGRASLSLRAKRRFQLGFNNLFVFQHAKP
jgi:2-polyprenyl-3-methyl-5-hydroxy-6-metoxy-1,4-benzoquinol methylase